MGDAMLEMNQEEFDKQQAFEHEVINELIQNAIVNAIQDEEVYDKARSQDWATAICQEIIEKLAEIKKPYKYLVFCDLTQNNGAGRHHMISPYWDDRNDKYHTVTWSNKTILCIVTIIGLALDPPRIIE